MITNKCPVNSLKSQFCSSDQCKWWKTPRSMLNIYGYLTDTKPSSLSNMKEEKYCPYIEPTCRASQNTLSETKYAFIYLNAIFISKNSTNI